MGFSFSNLIWFLSIIKRNLTNLKNLLFLVAKTLVKYHNPLWISSGNLILVELFYERRMSFVLLWPLPQFALCVVICNKKIRRPSHHSITQNTHHKLAILSLGCCWLWTTTTTTDNRDENWWPHRIYFCSWRFAHLVAVFI